MNLHREAHNPRLSRAARRGVVLGLVLATCAGGVASAGSSPAPVSDLHASIGQGLTTYKGQPKYKAAAHVSFLALADDVVCQDALTLERRVKVIEHRRAHFEWIVIRAGDRQSTCSQRAESQTSSLSLLNRPGPYRRLLRTSRLRLHYYLRISIHGQLVLARSIVKPVTLAPLTHAFQA